MTHSEFAIGETFWTATGEWLCTDIGTRTILAIHLNKSDESWYVGPPYGVVEHSFDESDIGCCRKEPADA